MRPSLPLLSSVYGASNHPSKQRTQHMLCVRNAEYWSPLLKPRSTVIVDGSFGSCRGGVDSATKDWMSGLEAALLGFPDVVISHHGGSCGLPTPEPNRPHCRKTSPLWIAVKRCLSGTRANSRCNVERLANVSSSSAPPRTGTKRQARVTTGLPAGHRGQSPVPGFPNLRSRAGTGVFGCCRPTLRCVLRTR